MELSWSTFIFEVINFLVLVWLLKRLLYRPVLNAIATRKKAVEETLAAAERVRAEARELQKTYEDRLASWERDKENKLTQFQRELAEDRARAMKLLESDLNEEREKQTVIAERRLAELAGRQEEEALDLAGRFSSRLLSRLAGPELESRLVDLFLKEIQRLPEERLLELKNGFKNHHQASAEIKSAFPLADGQKSAVIGALSGILGAPVSCRFSEGSELIAGLRVVAGPLVLGANMQDELDWFLRKDSDER